MKVGQILRDSRPHVLACNIHRCHVGRTPVHILQRHINICPKFFNEHFNNTQMTTHTGPVEQGSLVNVTGIFSQKKFTAQQYGTYSVSIVLYGHFATRYTSLPKLPLASPEFRIFWYLHRALFLRNNLC